MTVFSSMRIVGSEGSVSQAHEPEMQEEACEAQGTQTPPCLRRSRRNKEPGALKKHRSCNSQPSVLEPL